MRNYKLLMIGVALNLLTIDLSAQKVFDLKVGEMLDNGQVIQKGDETGKKIILDENGKKITYTANVGFKDQIFKIIKKTTDEDKKDIVMYECEGLNNNGIYTVYIRFDHFYQRIDIMPEQVIINKTGKSMRLYYK